MFDDRLTGSRRARDRAADLRDAIASDLLDEGIRPRASGAALVTIDVQNDFTLPGAPAEIAGTMAVVPNIVRLLKVFRARGLPIVHVVRLYAPDGADAEPVRRQQLRTGVRIAAPGSDGAELVAELKAAPDLRLDVARLRSGAFQLAAGGEWMLYKPRWGAFYRTALEEHLRALGVDTIVLAGCNFPNCPRTTLYEASERDFRLVLPTDAVSGVYDRGLTEIAAIGVALMTTEEAVRWIGAGD